MALPLSRSVLSLQGVTPAERRFSATPTRLDLELPRGAVALLQVDDEADASALVDLCVGLSDPGAGRVRFLGVDWTTRNPRERLTRRRRIADATALARLFGLPGLPVGRSETTPLRALIRAACVRGFLGSPDLIVVHDQMLDQSAGLAVPMAQAISAACDRGATVLWITTNLAARAAEFVHANHVLRLGDGGLVPVRRSR